MWATDHWQIPYRVTNKPWDATFSLGANSGGWGVTKTGSTTFSVGVMGGDGGGVDLYYTRGEESTTVLAEGSGAPADPRPGPTGGSINGVYHNDGGDEWTANYSVGSEGATEFYASWDLGASWGPVPSGGDFYVHGYDTPYSLFICGVNEYGWASSHDFNNQSPIYVDLSFTTGSNPGVADPGSLSITGYDYDSGSDTYSVWVAAAWPNGVNAGYEWVDVENSLGVGGAVRLGDTNAGCVSGFPAGASGNYGGTAYSLITNEYGNYVSVDFLCPPGKIRDVSVYAGNADQYNWDQTTKKWKWVYIYLNCSGASNAEASGSNFGEGPFGESFDFAWEQVDPSTHIITTLKGTNTSGEGPSWNFEFDAPADPRPEDLSDYTWSYELMGSGKYRLVLTINTWPSNATDVSVWNRDTSGELAHFNGPGTVYTNDDYNPGDLVGIAWNTWNSFDSSPSGGGSADIEIPV